VANSPNTTPPERLASERAAAGPDTIDLKNHYLAALLTWLLPGLGQWYQGRRSKAILFCVCILGTFVYGMYLGEGRVVYASWRDEDPKLRYPCQLCVGLPSLPALVQAARGKEPFFKGNPYNMSAPAVKDPDRGGSDELDALHKHLGRYFELATVYTMMAGLLNILAIYDAFGGPAYSHPAEDKKKDKSKATTSLAT
jgi:hypothetical protein